MDGHRLAKPVPQGKYEIVFNRPIAAVSTAAGDRSLEHRAQSWMYAIYQGATLSTNPNFARYNAATGVFPYNALAAGSASNGAVGMENSSGNSFLILADSMFSYSGWGFFKGCHFILYAALIWVNKKNCRPRFVFHSSTGSHQGQRDRSAKFISLYQFSWICSKLTELQTQQLGNAGPCIVIGDKKGFIYPERKWEMGSACVFIALGCGWTSPVPFQVNACFFKDRNTLIHKGKRIGIVYDHENGFERQFTGQYQIMDDRMLRFCSADSPPQFKLKRNEQPRD
jgi:hypothetical protein